MLTAVVGINWGDEGKGRIVDLLAAQADVVVRCQGGRNAGHRVTTPAGSYVFDLLPAGLLHPQVVGILGGGMVVDLDHLRHELSMMSYFQIPISPDNLKLSSQAAICMPFHVRQEVLEEERLRQGGGYGSTRRGIAYAYGDKCLKKALRLGDLQALDSPGVRQRLREILDSKNLVLTKIYGQQPLGEDEALQWCRDQAAFFSPYICHTGAYLRQAVREGKNVLLEAQLGALRDVDYGVYPYTAGFSTLSAYAPMGAGLPGARLDHVVGVIKAYSTYAGEGPFPAEKVLPEPWSLRLRDAGGEYGPATGRPRRAGPFDVVASRYGIQCQGPDQLVLTKLDVLSGLEELPVITGYLLAGKPLEVFPTGPELELVQPVIKTLPGWQEDISGCKSWESLPRQAKEYVLFLERQLGTPFHMISVGTGPDAWFPRRAGSWVFQEAEERSKP